MVSSVTLTVDDFGFVQDHISKEQKEVKRFTWKNAKSNVSVQVCTLDRRISFLYFCSSLSSRSSRTAQCSIRWSFHLRRARLQILLWDLITWKVLLLFYCSSAIPIALATTSMKQRWAFITLSCPQKSAATMSGSGGPIRLSFTPSDLPPFGRIALLPARSLLEDDSLDSLLLSVHSFGWEEEQKRANEKKGNFYKKIFAFIDSRNLWRKSFSALPIRLLLDPLMMIYCDVGYLKDGNSAYIGSMMGRVANRIANGEFDLSGEKHVLAKNFLGKHSLHGGIIGFDKFNWDSHVEGTTVYLTHVSPDEYEGYPGTVIVTAECKLSDDDAFTMNLTAVTSKPTIINMSNHSYFNLAGHDQGYKELYKVCIFIDWVRRSISLNLNLPSAQAHHELR